MLVYKRAIAARRSVKHTRLDRPRCPRYLQYLMAEICNVYIELPSYFQIDGTVNPYFDVRFRFHLFGHDLMIWTDR